MGQNGVHAERGNTGEKAKEPSGAEVRASIVAEKSGNSDGAKGCRKVDE